MPDTLFIWNAMMALLLIMIGFSYWVDYRCQQQYLRRRQEIVDGFDAYCDTLINGYEKMQRGENPFSK